MQGRCEYRYHLAWIVRWMPQGRFAFDGGRIGPHGQFSRA
jgi:hypothetical protein